MSSRAVRRGPAPAKSTTRRERALVTRRRMLQAAYGLFCEHGYLATTMGAIAAAADVAVQTLYFTFHTKGAILSEVLGAAVVGFEHWNGPLPPTADFGDSKVLLAAVPWYGEFEREPDARRALNLFIEQSVGPLGRTAPLIAAMFAAGAEPEVRAVVELGEQRRHTSFTQAVRQLGKKGSGLRPGLSVARAGDILFVVFSHATLNALRQRGWSDKECTRWFVDVLGEQLLAPG